MERSEFKISMFEGLARLLKALSNPIRLEILEILSQGENTVESIVGLTNQTVANVSQHLQVLKTNNVVRSRKVGRYVYYSVYDDKLLALYHHITNYGTSEIADLERNLMRQRKESNSLNAVSLSELDIMVAQNNVVLLDVRPYAEYDNDHITGAVSMPVDEILKRLKELSKKSEIVAYCRGPFCVLADEAVSILQKAGYKVRRLDKGYPEWKLQQQKKQ
ncbi:MAG: metalloregulator ArsR/SmtB family transcription factor [Carboxylicivirga sp.]|jgi:rhodanese-related sulfurtransferase|nr:metalloregulator ArsR/SmtB family transcription factor [Carboxylicivirga sp.]